MATENQVLQLKDKLKTYKKKYLRKEFSAVDESATRIMTNSFLTELLGHSVTLPIH